MSHRNVEHVMSRESDENLVLCNLFVIPFLTNGIWIQFFCFCLLFQALQLQLLK